MKAVRDLLADCESSERQLSYAGDSNEVGRRQSGAYYTPTDVAQKFWRDFFDFTGLNGPDDLADFVLAHRFLEPSSGSGVLFFALLEGLVDRGVRPEVLASVDICLVDISRAAAQYIERSLDLLRKRAGYELPNVRVVCADFLSYEPIGASGKKWCVFGNPPYVSIKGGRWRNSAAAFLEKTMQLVGDDGVFGLILPLSVSFSRDYASLRSELLASPRSIAAAHFDNMPDTLFKTGKPLSQNTNKANSQRITMLFSAPGHGRRRLTTPLMRWSRKDRAEFLAANLEFHDFSRLPTFGQFPRVSSIESARYIAESVDASVKLRDLLSDGGPYALHVSGVARNFIAFRDEPGVGSIDLTVNSRKELFRVLGVLASDEFYQYWRTFGDGFHVTRSIVESMPISSCLSMRVDRELPAIEKLWKDRTRFRKSKLNGGKLVCSYDFSNVMRASLIPRP